MSLYRTNPVPCNLISEWIIRFPILNLSPISEWPCIGLKAWSSILNIADITSNIDAHLWWPYFLHSFRIDNCPRLLFVKFLCFLCNPLKHQRIVNAPCYFIYLLAHEHTVLKTTAVPLSLTDWTYETYLVFNTANSSVFYTKPWCNLV